MIERYFLNISKLMAFIIGLFSTFYIVKINHCPIVIYMVAIYTIFLCIKNKDIGYGIVMLLILFNLFCSKYSLVHVFVLVILFLLLFFKKKTDFSINKFFYLYMGSCTLTTLFVYVMHIPNYTIIVRQLYYFYIFGLFSIQLKNLSKEELNCFISGFKVSCITQILWCFVQVLFYNLGQIDINKIIFKDWLNVSEQTSRYVGGVIFKPSGLCWHPSNLVVVVIASLLMFKKWCIWFLCVLVAFLTDNSTIFLSIIYTGAMLIILNFKDVVQKLKLAKENITQDALKKKLLTILIVLLVIMFLPLVLDKMVYIFMRITGQIKDLSANAHKSYYFNFFKVMSHYSLPEKLFGVGIGNSGYPFSLLFSQYNNIQYWAVESDPMNIIYGTGIIGFFVCYLWFFNAIKKSLKLDKKIFVFLVSILLCGITYNNQFPWVIILELIVCSCVERKEKFF